MSLALALAFMTFASDGACPDLRPRTGTYRNSDFGFELAVPPARGWSSDGPGCTDSPSGCVCMADHGWIFRLDSPDSPRIIDVYAGFALTRYDGDPDFWLEDLRSRAAGGAVQVTADRKVRLGGRRARWRSARLRTPAGELVKITVSAVRDDIDYELTLTTTPAQLAADRKLLEAVVASFKFGPHDM